MKRSCILLVMILLAFPFWGKSQYFSTGQDPARIRWRQINTAHFQLIYPEEYEAKAQQLAFVFEKVYEHGFRTMEHPPRKISVILHTHTAKSNGMVALAPKRVELFTTPHQGIYAQDWLEQLAIHEFRHVVLIDKIQQELPAILPVLLGEQAAAAVIGAYLPFWFLEGDAVVIETALSNSGRGRLPSFLMENKAQTIEKGLYSYNKAHLRSYRDFVPDHYKFGYHMVSGIREQYGSKIWTDVMNEVARKPLSFNPVSKVLKRETGLDQSGLYRKLFQQYKKEWESELAELDLTPMNEITGRPKFFTNYTQAYAVNDSTLVALKNSRSDLLRIVQLDREGEHRVTTPGSILSESFSGRKNMLIWSERRPDVRWALADRSVVVVYNMETEAKQALKFENNLFSPVLSPDLTRFAAVEVNKTNAYFLSVFDALTGHRIKQFSMPDDDFILTPEWDELGENLYFVALSANGKSLQAIHLENEKISTLLDPGFHEIRNPHFSDGTIYFTGSFTGINNIYAFHLEDQKTEQLSSVPFGADYPFVLNGKLFFSNYTADGYQLCDMDLNEALQRPFPEIQPKTYKMADSLAEQEDTVLDFGSKSQASYASERYHKLSHLFNFHSWAPAYIDLADYSVNPGISLFSQNKLGTAETRLGYEYNLEEQAGKYKAGFTYSGLFPVFDAELSYGKRGSDYLLIENTVGQNGNIIDRDTTTQRFTWKEFQFEAGMYVPFRFSQGKYTQLVQPEISYTYRQISHTGSTPDDFYSGYYHSLSYRLYLQNIIAGAELDLMPRWGQTLDLVLRTSARGGDDVGQLSAARSLLFFPGLLNNHGIKVYNAFQKKQVGDSFTFNNSIRFPRGYHSFQNTEMYSMGVDYLMPLLYPDISLGRFFYMKRLRASLFYDYANVKGNIYSREGEITGTFNTNLESVGVDLISDGHLLRLVSPVSIGVRGMYLPTTQNVQFQFLFSVSLDSL